jgi:DNA-binding transcriptional LysR family regulator
MIATEANLNDIHIFIKVVECGSFTAAAEALFLPKSSVSRKVSRLEERLGVRLLHRTTRSLTLTAAGRIYFERTSRVMVELEETEAAVAGLAEVPRGPLKITVPVSFLETGENMFVEFLRSYSEIRLSVEVTNRYVDLVEEGFDVAIRGGRPPEPSLAGHRILRSSYKLLASPDYLDRVGRPTSPSDLKKHDCLILGLKSPASWFFETARGQVEISVNARLACSNVRAILHAARQGLGIAHLPLTEPGFDLSGLELLLPECASREGGLWVVYPSSRHLSPAVKAFIDFLNDHLEGTQAGAL